MNLAPARGDKAGGWPVWSMEKVMNPSKAPRATGVILAFLGLSLLSAAPATAAMEKFTRTKPHVNMSTSSTLTGGTTQAAPADPWSRRPKLKCYKREGDHHLTCYAI